MVSTTTSSIENSQGFAERKYSQMLYSHNSRSFDITVLRLFYSQAGEYSQARTQQRDGGNRVAVEMRRIFDHKRPYLFDDLSVYIDETVSLIPTHLHPRFKALVDAFEAYSAWLPRADDADPPRVLCLMYGVFWFGHHDLNVVVLFRRIRGEPFRTADPEDFEV
ncbi:hypothetical protein FA13DRAFT_1793830 [Coprinellus micaceus]|uniref:Uncharacterized protein n=1 Tax=Coprinellus micaceus TaxID=71717 RepID=A0A4Y7T530_COPMI|nr:hypothetical protein FA13DRAFT_1793830 [Coprinellus micaceus]